MATDIDVGVDLDAATNIAAEHRPVKTIESPSQRVCAVSGCVALADRNGNQCPVHRNARRLDYVMSRSKCPCCGRDFEKGEWVTRESTLESLTHVVCPPKRPSLGRKVTRAKPLFDTVQD
jgi:hypothetical protein